MPNRILKENICRSKSINNLSWFEEVLFYRLIVVCDDYGRYYGDAAIIKGSCFPRKDVTLKQIETALKKLSTEEMVLVYEYEGETYLQLTAWNAHQTTRATTSKYPAFDSSCKQLYADECKCMQMNADVSVFDNRETVFDNRKRDTIRAHGEYKNVRLSDNEMEKLKTEFPNDYEQRIEKLSSYMASTGKKYKSHLATIRNWARRDSEDNKKSSSPGPAQKSNYDSRSYDDDFLNSLYKNGG